MTNILVNVDPDGSVTRGCYVKSRGEINCAACGFTPIAEASGALDLVPGSIYAGWKAVPEIAGAECGKDLDTGLRRYDALMWTLYLNLV